MTESRKFFHHEQDRRPVAWIGAHLLQHRAGHLHDQPQPAIMAFHAPDRQAQIDRRRPVAAQRRKAKIGMPRDFPQRQAVEKIGLRRRRRKNTAALGLWRSEKAVADGGEDAAEAVAGFGHGAQQRFDGELIFVEEFFIVLAIIGHARLRFHRVQ